MLKSVTKTIPLFKKVPTILVYFNICPSRFKGILIFMIETRIIARLVSFKVTDYKTHGSWRRVKNFNLCVDGSIIWIRIEKLNSNVYSRIEVWVEATILHARGPFLSPISGRTTKGNYWLHLTANSITNSISFNHGFP